MRSFVLTALLVTLASAAGAQGSRISGPIDKARSAAAAASARTEAQQRDGLAAAPRDTSKARRDSAQQASAKTGGQATRPNTAPQPAASAPAQAGSKTAASTKAAPQQTQPPASGGTVAAANPNRPSQPNGAPAPGSKAARVSSKAGGVAPAPPAGSRTVTPPVTRPSTTVELAADTTQRASFGPQAPRPDVSISREVYSYDPAGRRDPFVSLLQTDDLRPLLTDLLLVAVAYDARGRNSTATMRDVKTKEQYRARVGQLVGRMRVSSIGKKEVVFTIEEFGFSRQETLVLGDTSKVRK